jgi:hypothetical protein
MLAVLQVDIPHRGTSCGYPRLGWGSRPGLPDCLDPLHDRSDPTGATVTPCAHPTCYLSAPKGGGEAQKEGGMTL